MLHCIAVVAPETEPIARSYYLFSDPITMKVTADQFSVASRTIGLSNHPKLEPFSKAFDFIAN